MKTFQLFITNNNCCYPLYNFMFIFHTTTIFAQINKQIYDHINYNKKYQIMFHLKEKKYGKFLEKLIYKQNCVNC